MAFIKRLGWYLVGVSVGLVFLAFILKKKSGEEGIDFCYLPNCRVLKNLRSKPIAFDSSLEKQMDSTYLLKVLTDGDIDFGKSDTKSKPCKTYFINFDDKVIQLRNCEEEVIIQKITSKK
ncbi:DUF4258 domain-containing protein [Croceitalea sp. MTPC9]|uniref:DUF4258 domain-containing protein n=1 Tax=unclassified Croceitalea TaxID=2632280 RepID=UPI002B3D428A|nr:DUF4258 domain-containing protein [Croceitalea sp. MTPC6]GMN15802.1 DUF4258 domain-containing protein [Croceitalea sp. MTPC9]